MGPAASNIDDAIDLLSSTNDKEDRHPEKRMKASYKKFEEERYETVKQENPSLKETFIHLMSYYRLTPVGNIENLVDQFFTDFS